MTRFLIRLNATEPVGPADFEQTLRSLADQQYSDIEFSILTSPANRPLIEGQFDALTALGPVLSIDTIPNQLTALQSLTPPTPLPETANEFQTAGSGADWIFTLAVGDTLSPSTFVALNVLTAKHPPGTVLTTDEDRLFRGERIAPFRKTAGGQLSRDHLLRRFVGADRLAWRRDVSQCDAADIAIIPQVMYHYRVDETSRHDNQIKPIAFYLPQFHRIPENDRWWGEGFTEWTNVRRGRPMFSGHYQPHVPGELGYYDLSAGPHVQERQAALAAEYGIYAFCYYHYWFAGRRLLEKPLNTLLANPQIDFPFCICWANEPWSRTWDGAESDVLMPQVHDRETDAQFIAEAIPIFKDPRYVTIDGAPLMIVYRSELFPDFTETAGAWRRICAANGIERLHISAVQSFVHADPTTQGADSGVEFPPHGLFRTPIQRQVADLDPDFDGQIFDYREVALISAARQRDFPLFRGVMASWDNTARRDTRGAIVHRADPIEYQKWLIALVDATARQPPARRLIFINAWNEWAEGTHLEPDLKYGRAYLEATRDALAINC
jgi:hypothetical protein